MENLNTINKRLNLFVTSTYLSQAEFGRKIGKLPSSVYRYLKGDSNVQNINLELHKMGCSIDWLYSGEGEMFAKNEAGQLLKKEYLNHHKIITNKD